MTLIYNDATIALSGTRAIYGRPARGLFAFNRELGGGIL